MADPSNDCRSRSDRDVEAMGGFAEGAVSNWAERG